MARSIYFKIILLLCLSSAPVQASETVHVLAPTLTSKKINRQSLTTVTTWIESLWGKEKDWAPILAELNKLPTTPIVRYAWACIQMQSRAVMEGKQAEQIIERIIQDTLTKKSSETMWLLAKLQLDLGRGQIYLGHNRASLQNLAQAVKNARACKDTKLLLVSLHSLALGLIQHSRHPWDALAYINELLLVSNRSGNKEYAQEAQQLYGRWRQAINQVDDYFGRAQSLVEVFPSRLGIPSNADLLAVVDGVLIMNGDTDDQYQRASPEFRTFDGRFLRTFNLPGGPGLELLGTLMDHKQRLWAATTQGLFVYDGEVFTQLFNPKLEQEAQETKHALHCKTVALELPSNIINEISLGPDQKLYLATDGGLIILDPDSLELNQIPVDHPDIPKKLQRIAVAPDRTIAVAWREGYAIQEPNEQWKTYAFKTNKLDLDLRINRLFGLEVDRDGHFWMMGLQGAIQRDGHRILRVVDQRFSGMTRTINHVLRSKDGAYWFASAHGVCRQQGSYCAVLNSKRWLPSEWTWDLIEWPDNHIWASTTGSGLYLIRPPHHQPYDRVDGLYQPVNISMFRQDEYLWLVHGFGLSRLSTKTGKIDNFVSGAEGIAGIALSGYSLLMSTGQLALYRDVEDQPPTINLFDGKKSKVFGIKEGLKQEEIKSFCESEPGLLLVAQQKSLIRLDTILRKSFRSATLDAIGAQHVQDVACAPGGQAWILTDDKELYLLSRDKEQDKAKRINLASSGLQGKPLSILHKSNLGLFIFGEQNILRHKNGHWSSIADLPEAFVQRKGLDVEQDDQGRLYFATEVGVFVYNGEVWVRLTEADGLATDQTHALVFYDGHMWISGNKGVVKWHWPEQAPPETFVISRDLATYTDEDCIDKRMRVSDGFAKEGWVELRSLAGNFEVPADQAGPFLPHKNIGEQAASMQSSPDRQQMLEKCNSDSIVLDPKQFENSNLVIHISGLVPYRDDQPEDLFYHYRVDGGAWQQATERKLVLEKLVDGTHLLEVRATDQRLTIDPTPARYRFTIKTPLSSWYLAGVGFVFGLVVFLSRKQLIWAIKRFRHRRFRPISPCPFTPNQPVLDERFIDRTKQIEFLMSTIRTGGVAAVWGERGIGKHTLMRNLKNQLNPPEALVIDLDLAVVCAGGEVSELVAALLQGLEQILLEYDELLHWESQVSADTDISSVSDDMRIDSRDSADTLKYLSTLRSSSGDMNPFDMLSRFLRRLERSLASGKVVFILDNAEVLSLALDTDAAYGSYLFPFLRSLVQQRSNVSTILFIEGRWFDLSNRFRPLFTYASPVNLPRLRHESSIRFVRHSLGDQALFSEKAIDALCELAGGLPYLLHVVGEQLVTELNSKQTNLCTLPIIESLAETLVLQESNLMDQMWTDLPREEKLVIITLAEAYPESLSVYQVVDRLSKEGGKLLIEEARRALLSLQRDGIIRSEDSAHSLRGTLFRRWLIRRYSVKSVLEESRDFVAHYQLIRRLGEGGMGVVFRARDLVRGMVVAIKLLKPHLSENKRSRRRFLREAKLGKRLDHPNIVKILDYGEQSGRIYLAMEYIEGTTMADWLSAYRRASPYEVALVGINMASALDAIHRLGVVHRDIKSDNVMVIGQGAKLQPQAIKLMDFGLATGQDVSRMTRVGSLVGTIAYMSPEQARGEAADVRSDLYSLGVVLYELLTGHLPFTGNEAAVIHSVINDEIQPISSRIHEVPQQLADLIERLLEKDPTKRPQSAEELRAGLSDLIDQLERQHYSVPQTNFERRAQNSLSVITSRSIDALRTASRILSSASVISDDSLIPLSDSENDSARVLLYRVSAALAKGTLDQELFDNTLRWCCQALEADGGLVYRISDTNEKECIATYQHNLDKLSNLQALETVVDRSANGQVGLLCTGGINGGMGSMVCAPIWAGEQVSGVLVLDRQRQVEQFTDDHLELLACIGYLLGLGLQRERLFAKTLEDQRMVTAGHMLAGVAHDLRNPMTVISGYAHLMRQPVDDELRQEVSVVILQQITDMTGMIENLLSFLRGDQRLYPSWVAMQKLQEHLRKSLAGQINVKKISFSITIEGESVFLDESRLKRILLNLCKNAIDGMKKEGKLEVGLHASNNALRVEISDTGPGIPDEVRKNLFEPFVTSGKKRGTGLGLAIVKRFVDDHGGTITVDSKLGKGTKFSIELPFVEENLTQDENLQDQEPEPVTDDQPRAPSEFHT